MSVETENVRLARVLAHGVTPHDLGATSWADKAAIVAWQTPRGLKPDGIFGPRSLEVWRAEHAPPARVFGQTGVYVAQHVRRRSAPPHNIVIHDTVSHSAKSAQRTLDARGYATHFFVEVDGTVYQCMDPGPEWGAHCAGNNERSIGIDAVAILDPALANAAEQGRIVARAWSAKGGKWRGKVVDYTAEQRAALTVLIRALCDAFTIPHFVLDTMTGYGQKVPGLSPAFRGVMAHAQWSTRRWDGLLGIEALIDAGFQHDGGAET